MYEIVLALVNYLLRKFCNTKGGKNGIFIN